MEKEVGNIPLRNLTDISDPVAPPACEPLLVVEPEVAKVKISQKRQGLPVADGGTRLLVVIVWHIPLR